MSSSQNILASLGLDGLLADRTIYRDSTGAVFESSGVRAVCATPEFTRGVRHVMERERPGVWRQAMKTCGIASGRALAAILDHQLTALAKPRLAALPLDAALALFSRAFAAHGWGQLTFDLTHASDHGLVIAALENSYFAEALPNTNEFVDDVPAGVMQALFEHISGQRLACEEIGCKSRGAPHCTFVITAADRLAPLLPLLGREPAEAIIARLR